MTANNISKVANTFPGLLHLSSSLEQFALWLTLSGNSKAKGEEEVG
jgi:hypothetical protein